MNQISRIAPVTDDEAARLARPDTVADLARSITATPRSVPGRRPRRRLFLVGAPLAVGVAAGVAAAVLVASPGGQHRAVPPPVTARALSFVTNAGGGITVTVRDPLASPSTYRAEFARHHLNITLKLLPVSPSIVGTVVYIEEPSSGPQIATITARGACLEASGTNDCPVGVRIPSGFHGSAEVIFGRPAKPGEHYQSTASAFAPGEAMQRMNVHGETVAQVLAQLRDRHVTAAVFNDYGRLLHHVSGSWYVYDADPWAPGQVMLMVGPTRTPHYRAPKPVHGRQPVPSRTGSPGR